jgi:phosphopantetheinyl transferase (holo-ACP synthase)
MVVRNSDHEDGVCQGPDYWLIAAAGRLLVLATETQLDGEGRTEELPDGLVVTVATHDLASRDERHMATRGVVQTAVHQVGDASRISVSHTRGVSVVLATRFNRRIGVDVERVTPERMRLARRILTPREIELLKRESLWADVLRALCAKEAAYKAVPALEQRDLTFRTVEVEEAAGGALLVRRVLDSEILARVVLATNSTLAVAVALSEEE